MSDVHCRSKLCTSPNASEAIDFAQILRMHVLACAGSFHQRCSTLQAAVVPTQQADTEWKVSGMPVPHKIA